MKSEREQGTLIKHTACPDGIIRRGRKEESCGSSDAFAVYKHSDGTYSGYCFSCEGWAPLSGDLEVEVTEAKPQFNPADLAHIAQLPIGGQTKYRGITAETCAKYRVRESFNQETGELESRYYPYVSKDNKLVAFKQRKLPKTFNVIGNFNAKEAKLFGQQTFNPNGKFIVITEGEEDALAAFQMLKNERYETPVVSLPNGATSAKSLQVNLEWLETFETVVLCPDMDSPGQSAIGKLAGLFSPNKVKVMALPRKDACECLSEGLVKEFINSFWNAKRHQPDGIIDGRDMWDIVSKEINVPSLPYPWEGLNELTKGQREAEMVTWVAGSGVAKSTFMRYVAYHNFLKNSIDNKEIKCGMLFLEEGAKRTGLHLMSLAAGKLLHLPDTEVNDTEKWDAFQKTLGTGRFMLYDSFGSNDVDNIISRMRYMVKASDCTDLFVDHISIMVSDGEHGDERKALDQISTKFRTFCEETKVRLHIVSHLKRPPGKGHEEGGETSLSQLRGSAGIAQLSDIVIGIERNGQHPDPYIRNISLLRVLKNRFTGQTGPACYLYYDPKTGAISEVEKPEEDGGDTVQGHNKKPVDRPLNSFGANEEPPTFD